MNVTFKGWRLTVACSRRHLAVSLWRHDELQAGAGYIRTGRGHHHAFADWRGRSWSWFNGLGVTR